MNPVDKLNLTAKTIAEEMVSNSASAQEAVEKLGLDPKKVLTKATRGDILESFKDIVSRGGGITGEQMAEIIRSGRAIALQQAIAKNDWYLFRQIAQEIAQDPATGLTKANGAEVTINFVDSLEKLMQKPVVDIFSTDEDNKD